MSKTTISAFDPDYMGLPAHPGDDLVFIFSCFGLGIEFFDQSEDFGEDAARQILMHMAEKICIDKTYVAFKGTKFKNVFIREEGCHIVSLPFNLQAAAKECSLMFEGEKSITCEIVWTGPGEFELRTKKTTGWLHKDGMSLLYYDDGLS